LHWNFFFTLGLVGLLSVLLLPPLLRTVNAVKSWTIMAVKSSLKTLNSDSGNPRNRSAACPGSLLTLFTDAHFILGFGILVFYEYLLQYRGIKAFILGDAPRDGGDFIAANREGIFSCFGFLGLYCFGLWVQKSCTEKGSNYTDALRVFPFFRVALILGGLVYALDSARARNGLDLAKSYLGSADSALQALVNDARGVGTVSSNDTANIGSLHDALHRPSRRLCNLGYCLYIVSTHCFGLALLRAFDRMLRIFGALLPSMSVKSRSVKRSMKSESAQLIPDSFPDSIPESFPDLTPNRTRLPLFLDGLQEAQLVYFLLANVLTGLLKMNFRTLTMENPSATVVVVVYCLAWMTLAWCARKRRWRLKVW
jgi:hypothetical protein